MKFNVVLISLLILMNSVKIKAQIILSEEIKIPCTSVKYQGWAGTCWCYATTSFLESELIRMAKGEFDLSEMYTVRKTYKVKAQNYVLRHGSSPFGQGALAYDVLASVEKHGLVPEEVYPASRPEIDSIDHTEMANGLHGFLDAVIESGYPGPYWMDAVEGILDAYLGRIPKTFVFYNNGYTPISFAKELELNIDDYINFTSFTHHPFDEYFILEIPENFSNSKSYNLLLEDLIAIVDYALENGYSLVWNGEMHHQDFINVGWDIPRDEGWDGVLVESLKNDLVNQEERQKQFMSFQTNDDHAMHIVGRAKDQYGNKYYLIKDSYFGKSGPYNGYVYMSEDYFIMRTISITLNRRGVPARISSKL